MTDRLITVAPEEQDAFRRAAHASIAERAELVRKYGIERAGTHDSWFLEALNQLVTRLAPERRVTGVSTDAVWIYTAVGAYPLAVDWATIPLPPRRHSCRKLSRHPDAPRWYFPLSPFSIRYCPCGNYRTYNADANEVGVWDEKNARRKHPERFRPLEFTPHHAQPQRLEDTGRYGVAA